MFSGDAQKFLSKDLSFLNYREGQGLGMAHQWIDFDHSNISVQEFYAVIPYTHQTLVFITTTEDELPDDDYENSY